jgi:hypothetical protein
MFKSKLINSMKLSYRTIIFKDTNEKINLIFKKVMENNMRQPELPVNLVTVKIVKSLNWIRLRNLIPSQFNFE